MKCESCSTMIPLKSKFCPGCGKPVPKPEIVEKQKIEPFPPIMTATEVSKFLKISAWKFYDALKKKQAPPYFTIGSHKRFITEKVLEWAANQQMHG